MTWFWTPGSTSGGSTPVAYKGFKASAISGAVSTASATVNTTSVPALTEDWDTDAWWDPATGVFQPTTAGYYVICANLFGSALSSGIELVINKNGSAIASSRHTATNTRSTPSTTTVQNLNGTTDQITFTFQTIGADASWTADYLDISGSLLAEP